MVGMTGFEPATSCSQSRRATKLRYIPVFAGKSRQSQRILYTSACALSSFILTIRNLTADHFLHELDGALAHTGLTSNVFDIIERRAQRIIELVHRVSIQGFEDICVSVGVAATGTQGVRYRTLYSRAASALDTAKTHGENNYRVYFEEEKI